MNVQFENRRPPSPNGRAGRHRRVSAPVAPPRHREGSAWKEQARAALASRPEAGRPASVSRPEALRRFPPDESLASAMRQPIRVEVVNVPAEVRRPVKPAPRLPRAGRDARHDWAWWQVAAPVAIALGAVLQLALALR